MKRAFALLLSLLFVFISLNIDLARAESLSDYKVEVITNCWTKSTSMGGSYLYVPYLKIKVTNNKTSSVTKLKVKVVFYDESSKSVWSDESTTIVSSSDTPLNPGYNKIAYVQASVGYRSQISIYSLPYITGEVYVNDLYYGDVEIARTYTESQTSVVLDGGTNKKGTQATSYANSDPYGVMVTAAYWTEYKGYNGQILYVPYVKLNITNQQSTSAKRITVKTVFYNDDDQTLWDDDTNYLISSSDTPLKSGYNKTAFIKAGVGYKSQINSSYLPNVSAEIYVNDEYYGKVKIKKTYTEETLNTVLSKSNVSDNQNSVEVDKDNPYKVTVITNCWAANTGWSGTTLYSPYLKLKVFNQSGKQIDNMKLQIVFYDEAEKEMWSDESDYLVSSSDAPVKHGYSKTAFIRSSVGYRSQVSTYSLPDLIAEIYLNGALIGEVNIKKTYSETVISEELSKPSVKTSTNSNVTGDPFKVIITTNCWAANKGTKTLYTPYLKLKVINQQSKPADSIKLHVVFYNKSENSIWSDETSTLIYSSDTPLKSGYGKTSFIRSSVGYTSQINAYLLPTVTAEVYINNTLYGEVVINNTYNETVISIPLEKAGTGDQSQATVKNTNGKDFGIKYDANCWTANTGLNGETLYVPYLKISVTNQKAIAVDKVKVHVVFIKESDKTIWSDETDYLVSSSDIALKSGFSKTAFVRSSVGYKSKLGTSSLPSIKAEVYINDELYDTVTINKKYD